MLLNKLFFLKILLYFIQCLVIVSINHLLFIINKVLILLLIRGLFLNLLLLIKKIDSFLSLILIFINLLKLILIHFSLLERIKIGHVLWGFQGVLYKNLFRILLIIIQKIYLFKIILLGILVFYRRYLLTFS